MSGLLLTVPLGLALVGMVALAIADERYRRRRSRGLAAPIPHRTFEIYPSTKERQRRSERPGA